MSRNDPCPCGSGIKYKKCCGQLSGFSAAGPAAERRFRLNKAIAYRGVLGRRREEFCEYYVRHKQKAIGVMEKLLRAGAAANNETISCECGCHACCYMFVVASLQECEVIVYWLYRHPDLLLGFLRNYTVWQNQVHGAGGVFNELARLVGQAQQRPDDTDVQARSKSEAHAYLSQEIACPFLVSGTCSIYEIRPWGCAALLSTSPPAWCDPSNTDAGAVKYYRPEQCFAAELNFYFKTRVNIHQGCLPVMVFRLLDGGFGALAEITGVPGVHTSAMQDREVRATLQAMDEAEK